MRVYRRGLGRIAQNLRVRIEEDHEIDVARVIELPCPVLAERQHGEAGALAWMIRVREIDAPEIRHLGENEIDAAGDRRIGEVGERLRHLLRAPEAADIGHGDEERVGIAVLPECTHGIVAGDRAGAKVAKEAGLAFDDRPMHLFRRREGKPRDARGIVDDQLPEERGMVGKPQKEIAEKPLVQMLQQGGRLGLLAHPLHKVFQLRLRPLLIGHERRPGEAAEEGVLNIRHGGSLRLSATSRVFMPEVRRQPKTARGLSSFRLKQRSGGASGEAPRLSAGGPRRLEGPARYPPAAALRHGDGPPPQRG